MNGRIWFVCCTVVVATGVVLSQRAGGQRMSNVTQDGGRTDQARDATPPKVPAWAELPVQPAFAAGQAMRGALAVDDCQCLGGRGDAVTRIKRALVERLHDRGLDYQNGEALEAVISEISTEYNIPIQLDMQALDAAGQGPADAVKINIRGVSLRSALNQMLRQMRLTYIIQDEVLLITTPTEAETHFEICLYDIRDLIAAQADVDSLIDTIVAAVASETWAKSGGGTAEIRGLRPGILVISQTQAVHEQINEFLSTVRAIARRPVNGAPANPLPAGR